MRMLDGDVIMEAPAHGGSEAAGLLPSLVIAGAPKSGTSSVFRWLADHPDVQGSTVKETYYFVDPGTHMFDAARHVSTGGIDGYRAFFPVPERQPRVVVEATPSYLYSELALRELPKLPSRPHVLFLLREPASQIHSTFRYFQSNWDWIDGDMDFAAFLAACEAGTHGFNGNELAQHALRNAAYADYLLRWREALGADRLHVFLFETAFADKRAFMRELARRFGIDPLFYDDYAFPAENQTYTVRSRALQKLNIAVRSWLPQGALYNALRSAYRQFNTKIETPGELADIALEAALAERFRPANRRLAEAFGLDLGIWDAMQDARMNRMNRQERQHVAG